MEGFETMPNTDTEVKGLNARRRPGPRTPDDQRADDQIMQTRGNLRESADRTGGRAFMDTNDLREGIRHAMDDARVSYVLAYTAVPQSMGWQAFVKSRSG